MSGVGGSDELLEGLTAANANIELLQTDLAQLAVDCDTFWLIFGGALVFLMQAGFGMLEVGSVSQKNTKNILMKNVGDACVAAISWWLFGYGIALTDSDGTEFGGQDGVALSDDAFHTTAEGFGYAYATWFFQFAFAGAAATIVSGCVAERIQFRAYMIYSLLLTSFVYPVVVNFGWGDGQFSAFREDDEVFLDCGLIDFAGSGVVHMTGGVAGFVGSIILGPRHGRFLPDGTVGNLPAQNPALQGLGFFLLWFGWFAFNGCSTLVIFGASRVAAKVMCTTTLAAAAGGLVAVSLERLLTGVLDVGEFMNGCLGGLVSVTANCSVIEPYAALIIGSIGAVVYIGASKLLLMLKIDDVVNAAPVHMFCGMWGVIAAAFFATEQNYEIAYYSSRAEDCAGVFYGGDGSSLGVAITFLIVHLLWVGGCSTVLFGVLSALGWLRLSDEEQMTGMDIMEHGGPSYPEFMLLPEYAAKGQKDAKYEKTAGDEEVNPPSGLPSN